MKLEKINISAVTEDENKGIFYSLFEDAIQEIPACANPYLYHVSIAGEYWELDAYETIGFRYTVVLTPITDGQETTNEWELLKKYISNYSKGIIRFSELDFWGCYGIKFKSLKSLEELQKAYPWNRNKIR